jgi:hypothetical protein
MKSLRNKMLLGTLLVGFGLAHSGTALAAFDSFGSEIPLDSAARQIVPDGYSVDFGAGVDKSTPVSWGSANDWQSALSSAVAKRGLKAEFGSGTVVIVKGTSASPRPYSSTPSDDIVQKKRNSAPKPRQTAHRQAPKPAPHVQQEEAPVSGGGGFVIRSYKNGADKAKDASATASTDKTSDKNGEWKTTPSSKSRFIVEEGFLLHQTLNEWAEATGWKVVWNSEHDYIIEANASFDGDFFKASSDLINAMGDARPQITVDYYQGNKVIVISNKLSDQVNK